MFATVSQEKASGNRILQAPFAKISALLEERRQNKKFSQIVETLRECRRIGQSGLSVESAIMEFEEMEHPSKGIIFSSLSRIIRDASKDGADFLQARTAKNAEKGGDADNFIAGAVRVLLSGSQQSDTEKSRILVDASGYFKKSGTYKEAWESALLASASAPNDDTMTLRRQVKELFDLHVSELHALGLDINAVLMTGMFINRLEKFGVIGPADVERFGESRENFFRNLG